MFKTADPCCSPLQGHFAGRCILYGSVHLNASDQSLVMESSSSPSLCYFVSAISVCVSIYCFSLILYWMYTSCVDKDANRRAERHAFASHFPLHTLGYVYLSRSMRMSGVCLFFLWELFL